MAIKYGEFTFEPEHGFTGSAGKKHVKGYMRGGATKMAQNVEMAKSRAATAFAKSKPASKFKSGGKVRHYAEGSDGGVQADGPTIESIIEETKDMPVPKNTGKSSTLPKMSPADAARIRMMEQQKAYQRQYDADTEDMRENPMNKAKGGKIDKMKTVMHEFKAGKLHSGSKKGPIVKNRNQAIAIGIAEQKSKKMARGGATTVPIRMAPAYKAPKPPSLPIDMATPPMVRKPRNPPSLANIAMSRNPQMLKMGGRSKKK